MKNRLIVMVATLCAVVVSTGAARAQGDFLNDPKYGATQADRERNVVVLNYFDEAFKGKDYDRATVYMRELIESAPRSWENLYIRGVRIYEEKFRQSKSREERRIFMDSILWIHDKRIEAFGNHPERGEEYIKVAKARDLLRLMPNDRRLRRLCDDAMNCKRVDPDLAVMYFHNLIESYKVDDLTAEELLERYSTISSRVAEQHGPRAREAEKDIDELFALSGAASCENIEKIFKPKYEADPENAQLIESILVLFNRGKCTSDFQMELLEKYYAANPKPEVAMQLANFFQGKNNTSKALEYLKIAVAAEENPVQKANYLVQAAGMSLNANAYRDAASYARQAIATNPENGYGYLFLANAFAGGVGSACGDDFDRRTVYWLVVDHLLQARKYMAEDDPQMNSVNQLIGNYSSNFPKTEETFFRELKPGQPYTVNCGWISGRTMVRER